MHSAAASYSLTAGNPEFSEMCYRLYVGSWRLYSDYALSDIVRQPVLKYS
jgi:hypothetical protein